MIKINGTHTNFKYEGIKEGSITITKCWSCETCSGSCLVREIE